VSVAIIPGDQMSDGLRVWSAFPISRVAAVIAESVLRETTSATPARRYEAKRSQLPEVDAASLWVRQRTERRHLADEQQIAADRQADAEWDLNVWGEFDPNYGIAYGSGSGW
jgi:hypothetical protein